MKKLSVLFLFSIIFLTSCLGKQEESKPTGVIKLLEDSPVKFEIYGEIKNFYKIGDTVYISEANSSDTYRSIPLGGYYICRTGNTNSRKMAVLLEIYRKDDLNIISNGKENSVDIGEGNQFNNVTIENSSN